MQRKTSRMLCGSVPNIVPAVAADRIRRTAGAVQRATTLIGADMCKKILVVDDERCIADTLVAILLNSGYEATAAYDGHTALAHCEREIPELIISDVVMPGLNGVDMAIRIRSLYPSCKI